MDENKKAAQKKKVTHFITMAVLVILFIAFIFPFIMVIINAFKTKGDITADPLALVGSHGFILTNFTDAMKKMNFATSFTNSLMITTISTIFTILLSAMTAFVIVRNKWKACGLLFSLMIASMVIPFQVLMIPLVSLYGGIFGVLNSRITLILMHIGFSLSMATFMFHGAIHTSIPLELEEAALIDGVTRGQMIRKIILPLIMPAITICLFMTTTNAFKMFDLNLALTAGLPGKSTSLVALDIYNSFYNRMGYEGVGQAKAVMFLLIVATISVTQLIITRRKEVEN